MTTLAVLIEKQILSQVIPHEMKRSFEGRVFSCDATWPLCCCRSIQEIG